MLPPPPPNPGMNAPTMGSGPMASGPDYPAPPMPGGMPSMPGLMQPKPMDQPLSMLPTSEPDSAATPGPISNQLGAAGQMGTAMAPPAGPNAAMGINPAMGDGQANTATLGPEELAKILSGGM